MDRKARRDYELIIRGVRRSQQDGRQLGEAVLILAQMEAEAQGGYRQKRTRTPSDPKSNRPATKRPRGG